MRSNIVRTPSAGSLPVSTVNSVAPPLHQLDVETQLVERTGDDEVDEIVDALRPVVEARREEEHRRSRLLDREHVAQMDERERRLARHQDELPLLLQSDGGGSVNEVR